MDIVLCGRRACLEGVYVVPNMACFSCSQSASQVKYNIVVSLRTHSFVFKKGNNFACPLPDLRTDFERKSISSYNPQAQTFYNDEKVRLE